MTENGLGGSFMLGPWRVRRAGYGAMQLALVWLLDLAPNVLLIPGTRTRAHLAGNLASAGVELDDVTRAELARRFPAM